MVAQLGQTNNPKDLIPGEPELIASDLRELVTNIQHMSGIQDGLGGVAPSQWTGQASDAFRSVFDAEPLKWGQAVETVGDRAQALADFGDVLTWGHGEAQRAIEQFTQAQAASRSAAAQYNVQAQQAVGAGQTMAPFQDPGQGAAQEAQQILDNARDKVNFLGDGIAKKFGFEQKADGTFKKKVVDNKFGSAYREKVKTKDKDGKETKKDPGGWLDGKGGGRSYKREVGTKQSDGLLTDKLNGLLKGLGLPEATFAASAGVDVAHGSLEGGFKGVISGSGKLEGSLLGANASVTGTASWVGGLAGGAKAEAYLAKAHAEGKLTAGPAELKAKADAMVGAEVHADGKIGWLGAQGNIGGFAGGKISGDASASVAGVTAGVKGEAWYGVGAEASAQFGMGDDGKFHMGASVGAALGVGGKLGFDVAIDPVEVGKTVVNVASEAGHVAAQIGQGIADGASAVGHFLGF